MATITAGMNSQKWNFQKVMGYSQVISMINFLSCIYGIVNFAMGAFLYIHIPYSGFYLRGPNFCKICEVLTSSQILILKLLFYFREPATKHVILAPCYHI